MHARVLASLFVVAAAAVARAGSPLDAPAFSATPQQLLAAAKASAPTGYDVDVLRETYDIALEGTRHTTRWRLVFVVRTDDGAQHWASVEQKFHPSYQDRPTVRARVIDPSGRATELDPSAATDDPAEGSAVDPSDARILDAPLPPLVVGSVVEEEVVHGDRAAPVGTGIDGRVIVGSLGPVDGTTIRFSAPAGLHVAFGEHALPHGVHAVHATANGRETWAYTFGAVQLPMTESDEPGDLFDHPTIDFSTMASWNALANDVRAALDRQIAAGPPAWPDGIAKSPTLETARALLAWEHARIRQLQIHAENGVFPPPTPAAALARGAADDLTEAVLDAALLRQAGIRADLVLVDMAPGLDADPAVPSLSQFDRAAIRATIDGATVWIDPSEATVGRLGNMLHGRRALVLAGDTRALDTAPMTSSTENAIREVRTFEMPESGFARVTESSHETGDFAVSTRSWRESVGPAAVATQYGKYAKDHYSGALEAFAAPPGDRDGPADTTIVITASKRASTMRERVRAYLWPADVTNDLPHAFDQSADRRVHDLELATPYVHEIENRIILPDGYDPPAPAAERLRALGPLHVVEQQRVDGRTFVVTYRLEVPMRRLSAEDVEAIRAGIRDLEVEQIDLPSTAWHLADDGKYHDAIAEAQRLVDKHPRAALYHENFAGLLMNLGAGAAARREALAATRLEPKRGPAWIMLGWALEFDSFGRAWGFDCDRAGARAAFEKARAVDPKAADGAVELAQLLEIDRRGRRTSGGADLHAAIAAWRDAVAIDPKHAVDLARALLWSGDAAGAEAVLRDATGEDRNALYVTAIALAEGTAAALGALDEIGLSAEDRAVVLTGAARLTTELRAYPIARVLSTGLDRTQQPISPELMLRVARADGPFVPRAQPADAVTEMNLEAYHPERPHVAAWDAQTDREVGERLRLSIAKFDTSELPIGLVDDLLRSAIDAHVDGDEHAWRATVSLAGERSTFYLAADHGLPKVIGAPDASAGVGRHVLRLLAENDEQSATRLLDWLAADLPATDPRAAAFGVLWGQDVPRNRAAIQLAAAAIAAPTEGAHVVPILTACAGTVPTERNACDESVADALEHEQRWAELLAFSTAWASRVDKQQSGWPLVARAMALLHLGRFADADAAAEAGLAMLPRLPKLLLVQAADALGRKSPSDAWQHALEVAHLTFALPDQLAQVGWFGIYTGGDLAVATSAAELALKLHPDDIRATEALGAVEIEDGQLAAGIANARQAMRLDDRVAPSDTDWYAFGRYYEQIGLSADALAAYRRVGGTPDRFRVTPALLAAHRVAAMRSAP